MRHIIIIVVVVVVDDETYYWVYLSSNHLFQVYYKVRQLFYYKVRWSVIRKCDSFFITKWDDYYKVRQYNMTLPAIEGTWIRTGGYGTNGYTLLL